LLQLCLEKKKTADETKGGGSGELSIHETKMRSAKSIMGGGEREKPEMEKEESPLGVLEGKF